MVEDLADGQPIDAAGAHAFLVTQMTWVWALVIYLLVLAEILLLSRALSKVTMK